MKLFSVLYVLAIACLLFGCTTSRYAETMGPTMKQEERKQYEESRKIIYNAYMDLVVLEPDSANTQIAKLTEQFGGYVSEMGTYRTVIRVESQQLEAALEAIAGLGKVQSQSKQGADVTENYLDYQIRLDNALKARTRYLEQLQKAETVEAALKVEKELERLNETIDLLKGQMNRIDHLASFATITIQLKEKKKPGVLGYIGIGLYESVKWLFVRN